MPPAAARPCTSAFSLSRCWLLSQMLSSSLWSRSQNIVRACFGGRCKASVLLPGQTHRKTKDGLRVCLTLPRASRLHSRKTVRCSLRPQFSSIHGRASQTHGFRQLRKPACRIALQLRILMGFAFCIDGPREDWHQISRSQEQNGVSWKNRLPVQVVRAGTTAPPRQNGNSSF